MKVFFITNIYPPLSGGASENYSFFSKILSSNNNINKIYILTSYIRGEPIISFKKDSKLVLLRLISNQLISESS